jgi:PadR family transcriptional regulator PadR
MHPEALRGHIDTMVLAALRAGPAHGYALVRELATRSDGVFELGDPRRHRSRIADRATDALATSRRGV